MEYSKSSLIDAPQGRHFCQLHKTALTLSQAVATFTHAGIRRGEGVIIVASARMTGALRQHLRYYDLNAWCQSNQLSIYDSSSTITRFLRDDKPQWDDFRETIHAMLHQTRREGWETVRVYGEMVNDLWRGGNTAAAIELEEFWNRLASEFRFCLFCGYELNCTDEAGYAGPLDEIGRVHDDILGTADDDKFRLAVEWASRDVLNAAALDAMFLSFPTTSPSERKLDLGRQMILWVRRNRPDVAPEILKRTRFYYGE